MVVPMDTAGPIDVVRVIALVAGSATVGATLVVTLAYAAAFRRHLRQRDANLVPPWRGLLVKHVIGVTLSYNGLVMATMYAVMINLRQPPTWRAPLYTVLYLIGLWAMWEVLGYTRRREAVDRSPDRSP